MRVTLTPGMLKSLTDRELLEALHDLQMRFEFSQEPILGIIASSFMVTKELRDRGVPELVIQEAADRGKYPEE